MPPGTIPTRAYLAAPTPNPFRSGTSFEYGLAHDGRVQISIYDANGRRVTRLVDEMETAGVRRKTWNGTDDSRNHVAAGIYLLRFDGDGLRERRKIIAVN